MAKRVSKKSPKPFDRYSYYSRAVQSPEIDCDFLAKAYRQLRGRPARSLREDFCGTFAICCEWVKRDKLNRAVGIDLDLEPITYGRENYLSKLKPDQQKRIEIVRGSVITSRPAKVDMIAALNFSFYIFKKREMLRAYFKNARRGLKPKGLFYVDCFGGSGAQEANEEVSNRPGFQYFWDQTGYNPVNAEAVFHIHFKRKGERKREKVFSYDWRVWTIPEIREIMLEAGFKKTYVYWEGSTRSGRGDGKFKRTEVGEECEGWIAYVAGEN